jgi:hypothetical protein
MTSVCETKENEESCGETDCYNCNVCANSSETEPCGALALLCMPFTFIQDDLLKTDQFLRAARERGHHVTLDDLQDLHSRRLLVPLYRISDTPVSGRQLAVVPNGNMDDRRLALDAARAGYLRDSAEEGYSTAWPYERPDDEDDPNWWNGFLYSSWQLLELHRALYERSLLRRLQETKQHNISPVQLARRHDRILALSALTPRYLPGILGSLSLPGGGGIDRDALEGFRFHADVLGLLTAVGFDSRQLRREAEYLLDQAGRDPLRDWLPVLRHASGDAWEKLHGEPLDCLWLRIGAEVLLRTHEELAATGHLEALPDESGRAYATSLDGRLGRKNDNGRPLEQVLGNFGLSPHPRVLLVIEGKTERFHVLPLLAQFGLSRPEQVRVQIAHSSRVNPQLLARYTITPRLGEKLGDAWTLTATPTALVIAMDPENNWETPEKCEEERRKIKKAIREEVELQGGKISDESLDFHVNIYTWGEDKYELANFADGELLPVITQLAQGEDVGSPTWTERVRVQLHEARQAHDDIKVVLGPLHIDKKDLAELLWPTLLAKCEQELAADEIVTPILKVVLKVNELVAAFSAGSYVLPPPDTNS